MDFVFNRAGRICWIFSFGRSPDESAQTPIAFGEQSGLSFLTSIWEVRKKKKNPEKSC